MDIVSFNANGLRSAHSKGFAEWAHSHSWDVMCLQEARLGREGALPPYDRLAGIEGHFFGADKPGYSGVAVYSRQSPLSVSRGIGVKAFDEQGRVLSLVYPSWRLINAYFPSGSSSEQAQQHKFAFLEVFLPWLQEQLSDGLDTVLVGDFNIAHQNIDLKNWRSNQNSSGFLPQERLWLSQLLASGWVDVFRQLYPTEPGYSWWSFRSGARSRNVGWRIDYQLATPGLAAKAVEAKVISQPQLSDHAPLWVRYSDEEPA